MLADGWLAITAEPDGKGDQRCQRGLCSVGLSMCMRGENQGIFSQCVLCLLHTCFTQQHNIHSLCDPSVHLRRGKLNLVTQGQTVSNTYLNALIWGMLHLHTNKYKRGNRYDTSPSILCSFCSNNQVRG